MKTYLPFMSGVYTTAPGLTPLSRGAEAPKILDIDENYSSYLKNKEECRAEDITKYHCVQDFSKATNDAVVAKLTNLLASEYPAMKISLEESKYLSPFDAICSQLQEDVAVVQMSGEKDWLTAIHLCSPNHWDPRTKIGKPFNEIHVPVPGIERTVKNYQVMLKMIIGKEPFTRFAWGIATDTQLNHHPETPPGKDIGRRIGDESTEFFIRTERQHLVGLQSVNAFIFTIRTYFYKVSELTSEEKKALAAAVNSMTDASLEYKGMTTLKDKLLREL